MGSNKDSSDFTVASYLLLTLLSLSFLAWVVSVEQCLTSRVYHHLTRKLRDTRPIILYRSIVSAVLLLECVYLSLCLSEYQNSLNNNSRSRHVSISKTRLSIGDMEWVLVYSMLIIFLIDNLEYQYLIHVDLSSLTLPSLRYFKVIAVSMLLVFSSLTPLSLSLSCLVTRNVYLYSAMNTSLHLKSSLTLILGLTTLLLIDLRRRFHSRMQEATVDIHAHFKRLRKIQQRQRKQRQNQRILQEQLHLMDESMGNHNNHNNNNSNHDGCASVEANDDDDHLNGSVMMAAAEDDLTSDFRSPEILVNRQSCSDVTASSIHRINNNEDTMVIHGNLSPLQSPEIADHSQTASQISHLTFDSPPKILTNAGIVHNSEVNSGDTTASVISQLSHAATEEEDENELMERNQRSLELSSILDANNAIMEDRSGDTNSATMIQDYHTHGEEEEMMMDVDEALNDIESRIYNAKAKLSSMLAMCVCLNLACLLLLISAGVRISRKMYKERTNESDEEYDNGDDQDSSSNEWNRWNDLMIPAWKVVSPMHWLIDRMMVLVSSVIFMNWMWDPRLPLSAKQNTSVHNSLCVYLLRGQCCDICCINCLLNCCYYCCMFGNHTVSSSTDHQFDQRNENKDKDDDDSGAEHDHELGNEDNLSGEAVSLTTLKIENTPDSTGVNANHTGGGLTGMRDRWICKMEQKVSRIEEFKAENERRKSVVLEIYKSRVKETRRMKRMRRRMRKQRKKRRDMRMMVGDSDEIGVDQTIPVMDSVVGSNDENERRGLMMDHRRDSVMSGTSTMSGFSEGYSYYNNYFYPTDLDYYHHQSPGVSIHRGGQPSGYLNVSDHSRSSMIPVERPMYDPMNQQQQQHHHHHHHRVPMYHAGYYHPHFPGPAILAAPHLAGAAHGGFRVHYPVHSGVGAANMFGGFLSGAWSQPQPMPARVTGSSTMNHGAHHHQRGGMMRTMDERKELTPLNEYEMLNREYSETGEDSKSLMMKSQRYYNKASIEDRRRRSSVAQILEMARSSVNDSGQQQRSSKLAQSSSSTTASGTSSSSTTKIFRKSAHRTTVSFSKAEDDAAIERNHDMIPDRSVAKRKRSESVVQILRSLGGGSDSDRKESDHRGMKDGSDSEDGLLLGNSPVDSDDIELSALMSVSRTQGASSTGSGTSIVDAEPSKEKGKQQSSKKKKGDSKKDSKKKKQKSSKDISLTPIALGMKPLAGRKDGTYSDNSSVSPLSEY